MGVGGVGSRHDGVDSGHLACLELEAPPDPDEVDREHRGHPVHREGLDLLEGQEGAAALRLVLDWGRYANLIFTGHERAGYPVGIANVALAEEIGDRALLVTTTAGSAYGAFLVGRQEAIDIADRGLAVADGDVTVGAAVPMANPYAQRPGPAARALHRRGP